MPGNRPLAVNTEDPFRSSIVLPRQKLIGNHVKFNLGFSVVQPDAKQRRASEQSNSEPRGSQENSTEIGQNHTAEEPFKVQLMGKVSPFLSPNDLRKTSTPESLRESIAEEQSTRSTFGIRHDDAIANSLSHLFPKSRLRVQALTRRNQSKVSYTYQAVLRPSSPSYMASTTASRSRKINANKAVHGGGIRSGFPASALNSARNSIAASSQLSYSGGYVLKSSHSNRTLGSKSRSVSGRRGRQRSKHKLTVSHHDFVCPASTVSVVLKEKFLMKIFNNLCWTELLAVRSTCKKWYEIISTEAPLKRDGVIVLRRNLEAMALFNKSLYVWTQFRFLATVVFDFTDAMQLEFWSKHGKTMSYLDIRNSSMTLSALVEILSRCPNLEYFSVTWTAEMYSFNSEMIKKYYGIHFRNGTFVKLRELTIDKSYFLTDNALWSLLKWCGGSIHKLALTCGPEDHEDTLSKLKPRWSIEPIQNYTSRFGYSGNFKFLDFSGSNLSSEDLKTLARTEKLNSLIGIRLSSCKINDEAVGIFIERKGPNLEEFYLDNTCITEKAFESSAKLSHLRCLNISGKKSNFRSLDFVSFLMNLEDFRCSDSNWLTYNTLLTPFEALGSKNNMKKLDISWSNNIISRVDQRMSRVWFNRFTIILPRLTELNLNYCGSFGNDDNFKAICTNIPTMEKLLIREWTSLTDEGLVGMTFDDIIKQHDDVRGFWKSTDGPLKFTPVICNLKYLKFLDLGGCKKLTDISIQFGLIHLPRLTKLGLDRTQITDASYNLLLSKSRLERLSLQGCEHVSPKGSHASRTNGRLIFLGKI